MQKVLRSHVFRFERPTCDVSPQPGFELTTQFKIV